MTVFASEIIAPHSGEGGRTPRLMKLRFAAIMIVPPTPIVDETISGEIVFGRMWTNISLALEQFVACAASTYSSLRWLKNWARTRRLLSVMRPMPRAIIVSPKPVPRTMEMMTASSMDGIACIRSPKRMMSSSTQPPK